MSIGPTRHAWHYLGYTEDLEAPLAAHRAGRGKPAGGGRGGDGIGFQLAATWPGDRTEERRLHRYRNSPRRLCPICREQPGPDAPATTARSVRDADTDAIIGGAAAAA